MYSWEVCSGFCDSDFNGYARTDRISALLYIFLDVSRESVMDTDSKGYTFVDSEPESPPSFGLSETVVKDCLSGILWVVYESGTCRSLNAVRNAKEYMIPHVLACTRHTADCLRPRLSLRFGDLLGSADLVRETLVTAADLTRSDKSLREGFFQPGFLSPRQEKVLQDMPQDPDACRISYPTHRHGGP